ncbi:hypothetical protein GGH94_004226 [Coemansia aciculifera]|uniref:Mos1 transposase HTH domain-containing protein n=2 Tax=Coemansia TaxID=4863 RepID=A0A9W8LBX5_9FUNG|nr:hypothetical protein GGI19_003048 [Coemansia pectinata]KAJ2862522.1 hypothetical protein GGH94_004226 [Coemansia aciculifera]KAJ2872261.1 hypothetical protein GGH93_004175 [Coemansia aciculifera]
MASTPEYEHAMKSHIRVLILACFGMQKTPTEAVEYINGLGIGVSTTYATVRQWYVRFEQGEFDLTDHHKTAEAS